MKNRIVVWLLFVSGAVQAQTGNYFLSHFSPNQKQSDNVCFDMVQDKRGVFYFATQAGVLQFDGRNWDVIRTNGAAYAIELSENGEVYVGGAKGFGKITQDESGLESFKPLYEKPDAEYIFQLETIGKNIYFLNEKNLFRYTTESDSVTAISTGQILAFASLNEIFGSAYVSMENGKLLRLKENRMEDSKLSLPDSTVVLFSTSYENNYLVGTSDNRIFLGTGNEKLKEVQLEDSTYVNASEIIKATWVNTELVGLATLRGGIVFINPETGKTTEIINYSTGLPDNEIYTLISDRNQNVWAAHSYGFTRVAPYLPMRSFRYYPGLQGNLLCAITFKGNVYVGTSLGLFKLEKEEFYDELTYYVDVLVKPAKTTSKKVVALPPPAPEGKTEKGGFFKFLRKKKPETTVVTAPVQTTKTTKTKPRYRKEKRIKKILRSTFYVYKKVSGINAKVTQLVSWRGKLLATGLEGILEVNELQAVPISEDPVRFLFVSESNKMLIASTYDDKLQKLKLNAKGWETEGNIGGINDPVNFIFEEKSGAVWFCSFDKVYRLTFSTDTTRVTNVLDISNPNYDKTAGISLNDKVIIVTTGGFYSFDKAGNRLQAIDSVSKLNSFFVNRSTVWFRDEHQWSLTGKGGQTNLQLLNLFNDIRYISSDPVTGNVWIITGNNELLRFYSQKLRPLESTYPIFLKSINQADAPRFRKNVLEIDQEKSSMKIEVVKPDYIGANAVEYRYLLQGLNTNWSEWSNNNNVIDFPYLPPGSYTLQFQSKDIFGKVSEMEPVKMQVLPPYWKRTWFYALEFGVFTLLVLLSFRLSSRYNLISRLLSLLSIIILIEFIQTAAGSSFATNSGPVVDFLIQVGVAFVILPVEGFLRKFMLKSIDKRTIAKKK